MTKINVLKQMKRKPRAPASVYPSSPPCVQHGCGWGSLCAVLPPGAGGWRPWSLALTMNSRGQIPLLYIGRHGFCSLWFGGHDGVWRKKKRIIYCYWSLERVKNPKSVCSASLVRVRGTEQIRARLMSIKELQPYFNVFVKRNDFFFNLLIVH